MDDERTRQSLADLAELFLTQLDAEAPRAAAGGPEPARPAPGSAPASAPGPAEGPAPFRLDQSGPGGGVAGPPAPPEAIGRAPRPAPLGWTFHEGPQAPRGQGDDPPAARRAPLAAHVHAVMLGNLPGVSGPWLTQFAQALAEQMGPVAVIYADRVSAEIEVVEPIRPGQAGPSIRLPPPTPGAEAALAALLSPGPSAVSAVVLSVGADLDPDECELLSTAHRCTLLTGADDAAVVAGYARLKRLTEGAAREAIGDAPLGVAVMGSAGDSAQAAADKLAATAGSFLETPLEKLGCLPRLEPARARRVGSYALVDDGWDRLIAALVALPRRPVSIHLNGQNSAAPRTGAEPAGQPVAEHAVEPALRLPPAEPPAVVAFEPSEAAPPQAEPMRPWSVPAAEPPPWTVAPVSQAPAPMPSSSETARPAPAAGPPEASLARALSQAWSRRKGRPVALTPIAARMPDQRAVELAVDGGGRLHLLIHADRPDALRRDRGPVRRAQKAALALLETRRWAARHRELIASTRPELGLESTVRPACHLFVQRGDVARKLLGRVGSEVAVHVLERLDPASTEGWHCVALA